MSGHTPPPWKWADGYRGLFNKDTLEDVLSFEKYEGLWPATPAGVDGREIKAANCRLIRAAPDLLEALEGALKYVAFAYSEGMEVAEQAGLAMEAAIARAKGEQV